MRKFIFAVIALGSLIGTASAQDRAALHPIKIAIQSELSGEYLECSAYFTVVEYCIAGYPAPNVPKLMRDYQRMAKTALSLAASAGPNPGTRDTLLNAGSKLVATSQMQSINSDCRKIGELSYRYEAFCNILIQRPDKRINELREGRICTGRYVCAPSNSNGLLVSFATSSR
jgi:hypothetical protein